MERRVRVSEDNLREVYVELKGEGFTLDDISEEIGSSFRNHLYSHTSMSIRSFENLVSLVGREISHERIDYDDGRGEVLLLEVEENEEWAELIGMVLGDGHLSEKSYFRGDRYVTNNSLTLSFDSRDSELKERATFLLKKCIGRTPSVNPVSHASAVDLTIYGKEVVEAFKKSGLETGNKVENQVSVPKWIYAENAFAEACLRGLIDTDGSVYKRSEDGYDVVYFKNRSMPLLENFEELCDLIGVKTSSAGKYAVQVPSQEEVEKFLSKVNPIKPT